MLTVSNAYTSKNWQGCTEGAQDSTGQVLSPIFLAISEAKEALLRFVPSYGLC